MSHSGRFPSAMNLRKLVNCFRKNISICFFFLFKCIYLLFLFVGVFILLVGVFALSVCLGLHEAMKYETI